MIVMKIAVVTDSGSNYREEGYNVDGIYCVPLTISDENKTYLMGEELSVEECYRMVQAGKMLKTSQPPFGRIVSLFEQLKAEGYDRIFAVPICSGLSGCISAMVTAAEQVGIPLDYIDCYTTAYVELYLALTARKMLNKGMDPSEVKEILQKAALDAVTFVLPVDMKHLVRGGRITKAAGFLAGLLKISPVLIVNRESGGKNDTYAKPRTLKKAEDVVIDYFREHGVGKGYGICMAHVFNEEEGRNFYNKMHEAFPEADIYLTPLVSAVGVHTGIGCVACQFVKKLEYNTDSPGEYTEG